MPRCSARIRPCSTSLAGAQVEDLPDAEGGEHVELGVVEAVQGVGPVQGPPAHGLAGPAPVPAEVAEVERALEHQVPVRVVGRGHAGLLGHRGEARGERAVHGNSSGWRRPPGHPDP